MSVALREKEESIDQMLLLCEYEERLQFLKKIENILTLYCIVITRIIYGRFHVIYFVKISDLKQLKTISVQMYIISLIPLSIQYIYIINTFSYNICRPGDVDCMSLLTTINKVRIV